MRAILVVESDDQELRAQLEQRLDELEGTISVTGTTSDRDDALNQLRAGASDVVVVVPSQPYETVRRGDQAVFTLLHDTQDPFEQATIRLIARAGIDELNRELLAEVIAAGQAESSDVVELLAASRKSAAALRTAVERGDASEAAAQREVLDSQLASVDESAGPSDPLAATLSDSDDASLGRVGELRSRIAALDLSDPDDEQATEIEQIETDLADLEVVLTDFQRIAPDVLVSPLAVDTELISPVEVTITDFYAPGVIALLIQHLAITFAAMSLVRERAIGTAELFGVAPLGPSHILIGKYVGYTVGAAVVAGALNVLLVTIFGVPVAGSLIDLALVQILLALASLGIGFVISSVVTTDNQAVNAAMIVLLLSIFFSGFFLSLDRLLPQVRLVSWLLPITHALDSMRDIMFRGIGIDTRTLIALGGGTVALYLGSWWLTKRRMQIA